MKDVHEFLEFPPSLHRDNLSAFALSTNLVFHSRIKHLDTNYHFIRERVQKKDLTIHYIPTESQVASILTKGLQSCVCQTLYQSQSRTS